MIPLPLLTDDEIRPLIPSGDEPGLGALATPLGNLPLAAVEVRAKVSGLLAEVALEQTFHNAHAQPLEATYIFPLPDRAAVTAFRMEVAGRVIDGILKERGEAREEYDRAIQSGHRAAIAEEERPGVFTMRVGNILPREQAKVRLTLTMPLPFADGEATFRFPLVVAPRYIPGKPLGGEGVGSGTAQDTDAVTDASRISPPVLLPGFPNPVRLGIEVELDEAALEVHGVRASLHGVSESREGGRRVVRLNPGDRLNRDFILRLALGTEGITTGLAVDADAEGGTFALTLVPPTGLSRAVRPRDVVFVLDHSGSMQGWKMVAARRAVARMVDTLTDRDRFNVLAFDDSIATPPGFGRSALLPATDRNRFHAVEFLAKVEADGGTEMAQPLQLAADTLAGSGGERDRVLVLATDGQVGNEDQILRALGKRLASIRVFTVGIDRAVNEGFLQRLAAVGGGAYELVESEERLDAAMDRLHRRVGTPVLTGLHIEGTGLQLESATISPARLPDLFAGSPVVISGRFRGAARGGVRITATDGAGQPFTQELASRPGGNHAVTALWARGRLRDLEDRYVIDGQPEPLASEILKTSLRFGVLCRFTAFVAVDRSEVVNKGGPLVRQTQAVDAPEGWDMLRVSEPMMEEAEDAAPALRQTRAVAATNVGALPPASPPPPGTPAPKAQAASFGAPSPMKELGRRGRAPTGGAPMASMAPPPPAPAAAAPSGLLKKAKGMFSRDEKAKAEEAVPPVDLSAYRARAHELLALLGTRGDEAQRRVQLGMLVVRLSMLVEDLRSIGADAATLAPLQALLDELRQVAARTPLPAFEATTEQVLRAFAQGAPTPPSATPPETERKRSFWK